VKFSGELASASKSSEHCSPGLVEFLLEIGPSFGCRLDLDEANDVVASLRPNAYRVEMSSVGGRGAGAVVVIGQQKTPRRTSVGGHLSVRVVLGGPTAVGGADIGPKFGVLNSRHRYS